MSPTAAPHAHERVVWRSPRVLSGGDAPGLLGFRSDDFMADLEASLSAVPPTTADHVAAPEHWSDTQPPLFAVPARPPHTLDDELKLYQPAHGRFYLVAAHLCCRRFGFPDRRLSDTESVGFVLRRVEPTGPAEVDPANPATFTELAWVPSGSGSWHSVSDRLAVATGEEVLPLVPTVHTVDGRRSRLLAGLVPVGARERYEARGRAVVAETTARAGDLLANPHKALLDGTVIDGFRQLEELRAEAAPLTADLSEMLFWSLLDLVDFIEQVAGDDVTTVADDRLGADAVTAPTAITWATIVKKVAAERADLRAPEPPSDELQGHLDAVRSLDLGALVTGLVGYRNALPEPVGAPLDDAADVPDPDPLRGLQYVARCVYRRTDCRTPRPEWVSAPSVPFRFASFFDPDAPARPVQISLPIDTSQGGLRAFPRNVSILVSKQLRAQMQQVKKIDEFDGKGSFDLGMLCSLSIPIITICALILLMLIVGILNIVFFWLPLFKICLPKPGGD